MEAKRMRFNNTIDSEKLDLKIWQNLQLSKCYDENLINRLLESTRNYMVASDEIALENQAISSAIENFGLKKQSQFDIFDDSASDDSDLPSTSTHRSSVPKASSSSTASSSSSSLLALESEAINSAISSFGLHKSGA